ncbi:MAG: BT_3928 family protein [Bacteroidota bacterium]
MKKFLLNFCRVFVGLLFIFSGLIKANDPLGFGYKLEEYFEVFHMPFFSSMATGIAILLCVFEIVLGALLLLGAWRKQVTSGLLVVIIFFTILTFASAFFKVVTSCGCFGDAIPLTPWQSFSKDILLLIMIVYLFVHKAMIQPLVNSAGMQKAIFGLVLVASVLFSLYTYSRLPIIDFLPYKVGANIPELMTIPPGAKPDEYSVMYDLKNKATGETKVMNDKDYLKTEIWKDDNWEIVGTPESKLVKKGYEPKIKDLVISDASGTDYTKELIENPYYNILVVSYNLHEVNEAGMAKLNALSLNAAEQFNIRTVLLTSSTAQDADAFSKKMKLFMEVFYADAVPLKSMVRASPGVLLLRNGVIVDKWHYSAVPSFEELSKLYFAK